MKILILSDDFPPASYGGAGVIAAATAKGLSDCGHEVWVITTTNDRKLVGQSTVEGFTLIKVYASGGDRFRAYRSLYNQQTVGEVKKWLAKIKPSIVHAHNVHNYLSYTCLKEAKKSGAKVFLTAHDAMLVAYGKLFPDQNGEFKIPTAWQQFREQRLRYNPFRNLIIRHYLKSVGQVLAVSEALKQALELGGIKSIEVLHNGIEVEQWVAPKEDIMAFKVKYNLAGKKVILFGGRLSGAKGREAALNTLHLVIKRVPNAILLLVGKLDQVLSQSNLPIITTGWLNREAMSLVYGVSDVVLVPSLYLDPFPTVVLEAMAATKPVIVTSFGGAKEAIIDRVTGYVVNPKAYSLVADKLVLVLSDSELANKLGAAGHERVVANFALRQYIDKLLKIYQTNYGSNNYY